MLRSSGLVSTLALLLLSSCQMTDRGGTKAGGRMSAASANFAHSATADSILTAGESAYKRSQYDSANVILESGRREANLDGDSGAVARALTWLGLTAWRQGRYTGARAVGEKALAMKLRLGLKADLFRSYNALGLLAHAEGRLSDAAELFSRARSSALAVNDSVGVAKALGNLGLVHSDAGAFGLARSEFMTLRASARRAGDSVAEGNALANLGMLEVRSGDATAAIDWLGQARRAYGRPDPAQEENILGHLGTAYSELGEPQRAIAYMDSALHVAREHDLKLQEAEDLQIFAELLGEAGDHQRSLDYLGKAHALGKSIGAGGRVGEIARAQAREFAIISRSDLARSAARDAIKAHREGGFKFEELKDYALLAEIARLSGRGTEAAQALGEADSLAALLDLDVARENATLARARVADMARNPAAVLSALPGGMTFARMGPSAEGEALAYRARAFARLGQWSEAVNAGRQAVARLEGVRQKLGEGPLRAAFVSEQSVVYADLAVSLLHVGRPAEAFEVADAARGKTLLEHLSALGREARGSTADLAESQRLLRRIDWLAERLRLADTIPARERSGKVRLDLRELSARLAEARRDYEDRLKKAAVRDPRGAVLIGAASLGAAAIRSSLAPGEVMIEYMATPQSLLIFAATRDTIQWVESPISLEALAPRVRLAAALTARRNGAPRPAVLRGLYQVLIEPVEHVLKLRNHESLIIVPNSVLAYLPFAALVDSRGKYLVEEHSILSLPSASALPHLRAGQSRVNDGRSSVFAPFPEELPGTRAEAMAVNRAAPRPVSYVGARGTERELREAFDHSGIVHIASHAELNQATPMFSHIDLAAGPPGVPSDDGRFDVHELLKIRVMSQLVFLSGCETGAGSAWSTSFRRVQDYATLSQAFLYSGARDVVATLWRIDDGGAAVFAGRFYAELAHERAAEALAAAQRRMIRDPVYSSPRYWAAYTISGSGGTGPTAQFSRVMPVKYLDPIKGPDR